MSRPPIRLRQTKKLEAQSVTHKVMPFRNQRAAVVCSEATEATGGVAPRIVRMTTVSFKPAPKRCKRVTLIIPREEEHLMERRVQLPERSR